MKEAYLQFEGTKVYETSMVNSGGMNFKVTWSGDDGDGTRYRGKRESDAGGYKRLRLHVTTRNPRLPRPPTQAPRLTNPIKKSTMNSIARTRNFGLVVGRTR